MTSGRYDTILLGTSGRSLYPPVRHETRRPDEPIDLVRLEILQELLCRILQRTSPRLRMLAPRPAAVLRECVGLTGGHRITPGAVRRLGHFLRATLPLSAQLVEFNDDRQLGSVWRDETKGLSLSHCYGSLAGALSMGLRKFIYCVMSPRHFQR